MKRGLKVLIGVIICIAVLVPQLAFGAVDESTGTLKFDENGNFRIMIIADTQDITNPRQETLDLMNAALDEVKPDLVVFTGDNIHGPAANLKGNEKKTEKAIRQIMEPVTSRELPFCIVFGNHDDEGKISKEKQMEIYQSMPNCLAQAGDEMTGYGNYNLTIQAHDSDKSVFNLWFVDSGSYNEDKSKESYYAFVADDQIEWYKNKSNELKEENGGKPMPSILFQHMPVNEIFELLTEVPKGTENAVKKNDKYYILNESVASGHLGEGPCPPDYNNGQFSAWKEQGDIIGAFFGHDHVNDFEGTVDGINLVHTPGAGFYIYGNGLEHGVRVIDINEKTLSYTTETLYYKDLVGDTLHGGDYLWYEGQSTHNIKLVVCVAVSGLVAFGGGLAIGIYLTLKKKKHKNIV